MTLSRSLNIAARSSWLMPSIQGVASVSASFWFRPILTMPSPSMSSPRPYSLTRWLSQAVYWVAKTFCVVPSATSPSLTWLPRPLATSQSVKDELPPVPSVTVKLYLKVSGSLPPVRVSSPLPPVRMSAPFSPLRVSLPLPPFRTSSPVPPLRVSLPASPLRVSEPFPPLRVSLPSPPFSVSFWFPPLSSSFPPSPLMVSAWLVPSSVSPLSVPSITAIFLLPYTLAR
ncbi:hypothetical protein D3C78_1282790 [compost metagenome]